MQGPDGVIREAFMLGDWGGNWTEIVSPNLTLQKNTLHTFTFWLNGGENDRFRAKIGSGCFLQFFADYGSSTARNSASPSRIT